MEAPGVLCVTSDNILQSYILSIGLKSLFLRNLAKKPKKDPVHIFCLPEQALRL